MTGTATYPSMSMLGVGHAAPSALPRRSGLAIAAFVLGFCSFFPMASILGIVFGFAAHGDISKSRGWIKGEGFALAGIIFCSLSLLGWVVFAVVLVAGLHSCASNGTC
jgi:hypothetical protein